MRKRGFIRWILITKHVRNQLWDRYEFKKRIISAKSLDELKNRDLFYGTGSWRIEICDVDEYYRNKNKEWGAWDIKKEAFN